MLSGPTGSLVVDRPELVQYKIWPSVGATFTLGSNRRRIGLLFGVVLPVVPPDSSVILEHLVGGAVVWRDQISQVEIGTANNVVVTQRASRFYSILEMGPFIWEPFRVTISGTVTGVCIIETSLGSVKE